MIRSIRTGLVALSAIAFLASCGEDADTAAVREAARNATEVTTDAAATASSAIAEVAGPSGPTTAMTFDENVIDFGTVTEGEKVKKTYKFKNTGDEPLILSNAVGSCGCTVPQWPREPIAPGSTGEIVVEFNSQGKQGERDQKVTLTANTVPAQTVLSLQGTVEAKG